MSAKTIAVALVVLAAGIAGGWGFYTWSNQAPSARELNRQLGATVLPADYARIPDVRLKTASGALSRADLREKWTFLFFGFTNCPDVCPTTLQRMSAVIDEIRKTPDSNPRVLFVSVDYLRDTPQSAGKYANAFGPAFVGATAKEPVLRRLTSAVNATFSLPDKPTSENYSVQHSSAVFLLDPQGRVRALFGSPQEPKTVAREYLRIRDAFARPAGASL